MSSAQLGTVFRQLHYLLGEPGDSAGARAGTDPELLARFAAGDETAFTTLVQRHGPLVLGVCRRVLRHEQDAEDAFQATFLVLARKAGSLRVCRSLGPWLYEVAHRLAHKARVSAARRLARERQSVPMTQTDSATEAAWRELAAVVDEEVCRLPERLRLPLVHCALEGRTREQACRLLGWSLRTLDRRLDQARTLLRSRLLRRGLAAPAALLGVELALPGARAAVPPGLVAATLRTATGAPVNTAALALAKGAIQTMSLTRWKMLLTVALSLGLLLAGTGLLFRQPLPAPAAEPKPPERPAPQPAPADGKTPAAADARLQKETEEAIAAGLDWLVRHQSPDGLWSLDSYHAHAGCKCTGAGTHNDTAGTAFGLLPLLEAGETHEAGAGHPYARNVARGLHFLLATQKENGDLGGGMYGHALATLALCEAYRQTRDPQLKGPAQRALDYIVKAQHAAGGWRYLPGQPGDTSVTSYQVAALRRGEEAGLKVPAATFHRAAEFLDAVAGPDGASYGYVPASPGTPTMTAAGLLSRLHLGWKPDNPGLVKGAAQLRESRPPARERPDFYFNRYATLLLAARGGADWKFWEPRMRRLLLDSQDQGQAVPHQKGSWWPEGDKAAAKEAFAQAGGRVMVTSLALLTLQACAHGDTPQLCQGRAAEALWADLAAADFLRVRRGMRSLIAVPDEAVPLLKTRLQPAADADPKAVDRWLAELDDAQFTVREKATAELEKVAEVAEPALLRALKDQPGAEVRKRIERVLLTAEEQRLAPERQQALRGIEVLVRIGNAEARQVLETLARGAPGSSLTQEARAGLSRLEKR
jgi:RNA polymerase sigma factor (sigma-70 family)